MLFMFLAVDDPQDWISFVPETSRDLLHWYSPCRDNYSQSL